MSNAFDTATDANAPPLPVGKTDAPVAAGAPPKSFDDLTYDKINAADLSLTKQKIGAEAGMEAQRKRSDDAYAQRQERLIAAEGATMDDIKPWNAEKELNDRKTNLWEQFGSPGFVIAMIASSFSGTPMNSALNAGAAAMNAINEGDMDKYHKAFDAWKENSNLTLKRLELEEHEFGQIDNLRSKSMESWRAAATALATRFNDQRLLALLQNGMDPQAMEARDALNKSRVELAKSHELLVQNDVRMKLINSNPKFKSGDPKLMAAAIHEADDTLIGADDKLTPPQRYMKKFMQEHPDANSDEVLEAGKKAQTITGHIGGGWAGLKDARVRQLEEENPGRDRGDIIKQVESEFTKAPQPKTFSNPEQKTLSTVPELMKHLETLDAFSSATGTISGLVQRLGAEYGGVNDPAIIWQTAKRQAEAAVAELASGGRVSVVGLKHQLEQLPDDYKAARFGKYQVQEFMRDLRDKSQSELDIMEASGKKIPPEVLDKFAAIGVYPASHADKDPLLVLREDPSKVPTAQLTAMSRYMAALPLDDQRKIVAEAKRRLAAAQGGQ